MPRGLRASRRRGIRAPGDRADARHCRGHVEVAGVQGADETARGAGMTLIHPDGVTLNDYVDDALPAQERTAVDTHLATCASCREIVVGLRSVIAAASALKPVDPPSRTWTRIERQLRIRPVGTRAPWWPWLAAAAALALATAGGLRLSGVWPKPPAPGVATVVPASDAEAVQAEVLAALQHYQNAVAGLERIASSEKGTL